MSLLVICQKASRVRIVMPKIVYSVKNFSEAHSSCAERLDIMLVGQEVAMNVGNHSSAGKSNMFLKKSTYL